ncbi:DEAD/DEAH box helicase [Halanaeroarchaeum sulfurireducens]|uniref:Hef nuclease n=1 Tax=Halanaeroarchaeum sulfurireducens TaxID=1604004 RepID=A0A0N9N7A2_9EURY|nr:DEAD/DEAH box helicase [Halanaeroarchaeum sulfurireducens]ALG80960.1 Hef nuclease [Halanaeroarchaeum sulfurireducens]
MPGGETTYVTHPLIEDGVIEERRYQTQLVAGAREEHTLVSLPTGLGKTTVSLRVTADRLAADAGGKSLLLAPTKPLVEQHAAFYREALTLSDDDIVVFTGETRPDDRAELWSEARIVIATPQVVENDLIGGRIDLRDVVHCTFDECHRATGDYAYTYIAERYHQDAADPLVTGMSASPGDDEESILQVAENLGLVNVEVRTEEDPDVAEYTYDTDVEWERIELPEAVIDIRDELNEVIEDRLGALADLGVTTRTSPDLSQSDLNDIRSKLQRLIDRDDSAGYEGMSIHAEVMKLRRAVELVETQSVAALERYFERQRNAARSSGASKASQRFVSDPRVKTAMRKAEEFDDLHPKFRRARMLLAGALGLDDGDRVIVFTESRDTAEALTDFLGEHFATRRFVGQGDKEGSDGMTQKQQRETLADFHAGEFEVLVSTSVAEEGLDVPEVDLVLFFEPVPTAIRSVQRKGRTGRQTEGRVVVLMAEDTRDEAYYWISRNREKEMQAELEALEDLANEVEGTLRAEQASVEHFDDEAKRNAGGGDDESEGSSQARQEPQPSATDGRGQSGLEDFADPTDRRQEDASDDEDEPDEDESAGNDDSTGSGGAETVGRAGTEDAETVEIVVDQRELDADIARDLSKRSDVETRLETLAVGDYVLSDRVAIERKTLGDFLDTLLGGDRSLFEQLGDLRTHYARPVLVLEGEGDLYTERDIHPNAIRGALASLAVDFGVSLLRTRDEDDTTALLATIAEREQAGSDREVSVHGEKTTKTMAEQQEYVVSSIADIGPVTARTLLTAFGDVESVLTADREDLLDVDGVGAVTADRIREVVASPYDPDRPGD